MVLISLSIDFQIMLNASRRLETLVSGMPAVRSSACNNPTIHGATHLKEIFPIQHVTQWQAFPRSWADEPCFERYCPADPVDVLLDLDSGYVMAIVHSIMTRRNYALYAGCVMTGVVLLTTEDNVHAGIGVAQGVQYVIHTTVPCPITMNDDNKQLQDRMPNKLAA